MKTSAIVVLLASTALAASPELDKARAWDPLLGGAAAAAQQKLGCAQAWESHPGKTPDGKRFYTTFICATTGAQVYVSDGKVFAIGVQLESKLDAKVAAAKHKAAKQALVTANCTVTDRGQAAVGECPNGKGIALIDNWDSERRSNSLSMLYGQAEVLVPMLGGPFKK